jgi:hypothetical protein
MRTGKIRVRHETIRTKPKDWHEIEDQIKEAEKTAATFPSPSPPLTIEYPFLSIAHESHPLEGGVKQYE